MDEQVANQPPVEIPIDQLSEETLAAVIESFILREGTDYGREEVAYDTKAEQVKRQLARGDIKIVFDPNTESITFLTKDEWRKRPRAQPSAPEADF